MENNKKQISEGLLTNIVDNFFKSLQKGVSDRYIQAAQKAGMHPDAVKAMKNIDSHWEELQKIVKKNNID